MRGKKVVYQFIEHEITQDHGTSCTYVGMLLTFKHLLCHPLLWRYPTHLIGSMENMQLTTAQL